MKTAQALLGHSDLETTLNIYAHALPASQRRAVNRVSKVLFTAPQPRFPPTGKIYP
jgi:integrase